MIPKWKIRAKQQSVHYPFILTPDSGIGSLLSNNGVIEIGSSWEVYKRNLVSDSLWERFLDTE